MDSAALRAAQQPLKDRYREDPAAAVLTLHAAGSLSDSTVACSVQAGAAMVEAGLHEATGGG
ncbi:MAG: OsmC family protein, partial [Mycobacteriales bacterium]